MYKNFVLKNAYILNIRVAKQAERKASRAKERLIADTLNPPSEHELEERQWIVQETPEEEATTVIALDVVLMLELELLQNEPTLRSYLSKMDALVQSYVDMIQQQQQTQKSLTLMMLVLRVQPTVLLRSLQLCRLHSRQPGFHYLKLNIRVLPFMKMD